MAGQLDQELIFELNDAGERKPKLREWYVGRRMSPYAKWRPERYEAALGR